MVMELREHRLDPRTGERWIDEVLEEHRELGHEQHHRGSPEEIEGKEATGRGRGVECVHRCRVLGCEMR